MSRTTEIARMLAVEHGDADINDEQETTVKSKTNTRLSSEQRKKVSALHAQYTLADLCKVFNSKTPPEIRLCVKRLDGEYRVRFNYNFDDNEPVQEGFATIEELFLHLLDSKKKKPRSKKQ